MHKETHEGNARGAPQRGTQLLSPTTPHTSLHLLPARNAFLHRRHPPPRRSTAWPAQLSPRTPSLLLAPPSSEERLPSYTAPTSQALHSVARSAEPYDTFTPHCTLFLQAGTHPWCSLPFLQGTHLPGAPQRGPQRVPQRLAQQRQRPPGPCSPPSAGRHAAVFRSAWARCTTVAVRPRH